MTANFGLLDTGTGKEYLSALQAFGAGREVRAQEIKMQRDDQAFARGEQARQMIGAGASVREVRAVDPQSAYDYSKHLADTRDDEVKSQLANAKALASVGQAIRAAPPGDRRMAILQQAAPMLQSAGIDASMLGQIDVNNDGQLDSIIAANNAFIGQAEQYTLAPGSRRFDSTGRMVAEAPFAPQLRTVNEGQSLVEVNPGGGGQTSSGGGIPFDNLIRQESGGRQFAANGRPLTSSAGAIGIAQVMPKTAPEAARLAGVAFDDNRYRNDPDYNRQLGEAYFNEQRRTFGRDDYAAAAYNAGPGAVRRAVSRGGDRWREFLPAETQDYLRKVEGSSSRVGGGARVVAQGAPKAIKPEKRSERMTPGEVAGEGLPAGVYYRDETGMPKLVGGQTATTIAGGKPLTAAQKQVVASKINSTRAIANQIKRVETAMLAVEKDGNTGYFMGRVPGGLDPESDTFDKAVAQLAPLIRQLTRVPGEGAMSDYESKLATMTLPSRTDTKEGRREALAGMRELVGGLMEGYGGLGTPDAAKPQTTGGVIRYERDASGKLVRAK